MAASDYVGANMVANLANPQRINLSILQKALDLVPKLGTSDDRSEMKYHFNVFSENLGNCFAQANLPQPQELFATLRAQWVYLNTARKTLKPFEISAMKTKYGAMSKNLNDREIQELIDPTTIPINAPIKITLRTEMKKICAMIEVAEKASQITNCYREFLMQYVQFQQITLAAIKVKIPTDAIVSIEHLLNEKRSTAAIVDNATSEQPDQDDAPELEGSELDDVGAHNGMDLGATTMLMLSISASQI